MDTSLCFILSVIVLAYLFDFVNGFHDAANSIATIVTTGVLTPMQAVLWAAFFNFIAFAFFNLLVAKTIGQDLVDIALMDAPLIFSALIGAIIWNLFTWYMGLPSSSSHALVGGIAGAAITRGGLFSLKLAGFTKVAIGIFISPLIGLLISWLVGLLLTHCLHYKHCQEASFYRLFKLFQLASSALLSLTHGGNDAQKTMGIIAMLLFSTSWLTGPFYIPFWVVISCHAVISLGTLAGGWRIVHTLGKKITTLTPMRGCVVESSSAAIILTCTEFGVPVSTTQTLTGAIAGVGLVEGHKNTNWPMLRRIYLSWLLTIPASALMAAALSFTIRFLL